MWKRLLILALSSLLLLSLAIGVSANSVSVNDAYDSWAMGYWHWQDGLITYGNATYRYSYVESPYDLSWGLSFPDDPIVYNGYMPKSSSTWDITVTDITYIYSSLYLHFDKSLIWQEGYEYTFYLRFAGYGKTESGERIETKFNIVAVLSDESPYYLASTKTVSAVEGYEDYYKIVFVPPEDMTVSSFLFAFDDMQSIEDFSDNPVTLNIDCVLSSVVMSSVDDDLAFVEVNPQLSQIQESLDKIYGNDSDSVPGMSDGADAMEEQHEALDNLMNSIPMPDGSQWWSSAYEMLVDASLLSALQWWGDAFNFVTGFSLLSNLVMFSALLFLFFSVLGVYRSAIYRLNRINEKKLRDDFVRKRNDKVRRSNINNRRYK